VVRGNSCGQRLRLPSRLLASIAFIVGSRHSLPALGAQRQLRRGRAPLHLLSAADLDGGRGAGLILPWTLVPVALTFLILAGTGLSTRALARLALANFPATLAGCVSIFRATHSSRPMSAPPSRVCRRRLDSAGASLWIARPGSITFFANPGGRRALNGSAVPLALAVAGAWPPIQL